MNYDREERVYTTVGFVEISKIFATQKAYFIGAEPFDKV